MPTELSLYEILHSRLVSGEFEPGQRLKPEDLRQDYPVSATTIREILFRLSTVGLVDSLEQRGFRVPEQSIALRHDLTRMRIMLESEGASLSMRYGGVAWEAQLSAAHHELKHIETRIRTAEQATDPEQAHELLTLLTAAELKFHRTLIDACRSEVLKEFHLQVYYRFRQQLLIADKEFIFLPENIDQHQVILDAALSRNETLLRERIHAHLSRTLTEDLL